MDNSHIFKDRIYIKTKSQYSDENYQKNISQSWSKQFAGNLLIN